MNNVITSKGDEMSIMMDESLHKGFKVNIVLLLQIQY